MMQQIGDILKTSLPKSRLSHLYKQALKKKHYEQSLFYLDARLKNIKAEFRGERVILSCPNFASCFFLKLKLGSWEERGSSEKVGFRIHP